MAVTSEQVRTSYAGNGATLAFAVPWYFTAADDLLVILLDAAGVEFPKTLTTHYTVAGVGAPAGGTVTMLIAPLTGETLHIIHSPDLLQSVVLTAGQALPVEVFEQELDHLTHQGQRTRDLVLRAPRLAETDTPGSGAYDAASNRIKNLDDPVAGQDAVTKAWALANFATASGPSALPPAGSLTNAMWDAASELDPLHVDALTVGQMAGEVDPFPGSVLTAAVDLVGSVQELQYQLRRTINWLDAGARAHAYVDVPAGDLPAYVAAQIAASLTTNQNKLRNGSLGVSQRFPSESASGSVASGVDAYVCDRWFLFPTGGLLTWGRFTTGLHSAARSHIGLELIGGAGITNARIGTRLGRGVTRALGALLANKNVTFGVKVRHSGSGGGQTPNFHVRSTSHALGDSDATKFAAGNMTNRITQPFPGLLTPGLEVAFTHTFDIGAMVDSQNGIELYVDFLSMTSPIVAYKVTDLWLADGDISAALLPDDFNVELQDAKRHYVKTFQYGTQPAQGIGVADALAANASDGGNPFAFLFPHRPDMRGVPTLTTYNPIALNALPNNNAGDDGVLGTARPSRTNTVQEFTTTGSKKRVWYLHLAADADWYD